MYIRRDWETVEDELKTFFEEREDIVVRAAVREYHKSINKYLEHIRFMRTKNYKFGQLVLVSSDNSSLPECGIVIGYGRARDSVLLNVSSNAPFNDEENLDKYHVYISEYNSCEYVSPQNLSVVDESYDVPYHLSEYLVRIRVAQDGSYIPYPFKPYK